MHTTIPTSPAPTLYAWTAPKLLSNQVTVAVGVKVDLPGAITDSYKVHLDLAGNGETRIFPQYRNTYGNVRGLDEYPDSPLAVALMDFAWAQWDAAEAGA
jgi:hypothetical protein